MKKKKKPRQLKHIPALSPDKLAIALQRVDALAAPQPVKRQLKEMLQAAANPDNEAVDTIISTLEPERQKQIQGIASAVGRIVPSVVSRAAGRLNEMSDNEWDALVKEANGE